MIFNEINFIRQLKICENIVQIDQVYSCKNAVNGKKMIFIVMKFAKYGSVLRLILKNCQFTETQIRNILEQLLLALDLMHRNNIIHRDIKPDNVLVIDKELLKISISDLGLACKSDDENEVRIKCGTPGYVDPEVLNGGCFTTKSDIFSVGSLFFNLITFTTLFNGKDSDEMLHNNKYENPYNMVQTKVQNVSSDCKHLLLWML